MSFIQNVKKNLKPLSNEAKKLINKTKLEVKLKYYKRIENALLAKLGALTYQFKNDNNFVERILDFKPLFNEIDKIKQKIDELKNQSYSYNEKNKYYQNDMEIEKFKLELKNECRSQLALLDDDFNLDD